MIRYRRSPYRQRCRPRPPTATEKSQASGFRGEYSSRPWKRRSTASLCPQQCRSNCREVWTSTNSPSLMRTWPSPRGSGMKTTKVSLPSLRQYTLLRRKYEVAIGRQQELEQQWAALPQQLQQLKGLFEQTVQRQQALEARVQQLEQQNAELRAAPPPGSLAELQHTLQQVVARQTQLELQQAALPSLRQYHARPRSPHK
eukprot:NODE_4552_length_772_cov_10.541085_g4393_i0.p1 GENE.NODE_4552_length_772_cov_10.541085_g4393_i0~~NODE_4552_length_772_cov_10.541085_g4393_i0.p1  ORF type:complete len:200 (+),score=26.25 NODE_4552_length_772_cov_10.541085_g4393_i0:95-694(+)